MSGALRIPPSRYPAPSPPALSVVPSSSDPQLRSAVASVGSTGKQVTTEQYIHTNASSEPNFFRIFFLHKMSFELLTCPRTKLFNLLSINLVTSK